MAVTNTEAITITEPWATPTWPEVPPDPARTRGGYNPMADEVVIRFAGTAGQRAVVLPIAASDDLDINVLSADRTGVVIGVQVDHLLFSAVAEHPSWRALADPVPPPAVVAELLLEVKRRFDRYGAGETPPAIGR